MREKEEERTVCCILKTRSIDFYFCCCCCCCSFGTASIKGSCVLFSLLDFGIYGWEWSRICDCWCFVKTNWCFSVWMRLYSSHTISRSLVLFLLFEMDQPKYTIHTEMLIWCLQYKGILFDTQSEYCVDVIADVFWYLQMRFILNLILKCFVIDICERVGVQMDFDLVEMTNNNGKIALQKKVKRQLKIVRERGCVTVQPRNCAKNSLCVW